MTDKKTLHGHRMRMLLYGLLMFAVMLVIYYMSSKSGEESKNISDLFSESFIGRILVRFLPLLTENVRTSLRKYAHMFEFSCLGISSFLFFFELFWNRTRRLARTASTSVIWSFLYACSDEWHQTFVPERGGRISDLRFDAAGILAGIALVYLIIWNCSRKGRADTD